MAFESLCDWSDAVLLPRLAAAMRREVNVDELLRTPIMKQA